MHSENFNINNLRGFTFSLEKEVIENLNFNSSFSIFPNKFTIYNDQFNNITPVPLPIKSFSLLTSYFHNFFSFFFGIENGNITTKLDSSLSPFLNTNSTLITDFNEFLINSSISFRQPWSNFNVSTTINSFTLPKNYIFSSFLGSPQFGLGFSFCPQISISQTFSFGIHYSKNNFLFNSLYLDKQIIFRISKIISQNISIGTEFKIDKNLNSENNIYWNFLKNDTIKVHSLISIMNGKIQTEIKKSLSNNSTFIFNCMMDYRNNDFSFGVAYMIKK